MLAASTGLAFGANCSGVYGAPGEALPFPLGGTGGQAVTDSGSGGLGGVVGSGGSCETPAKPIPTPCSLDSITCGSLCVSPNDPAFGCGDPSCTPCTLTKGSAAGCVTGTCIESTCEYGFHDCDGNPANGCETATLADALNCGGCGHDCVDTACFQGVCEAMTIADDLGDVQDIALDADTVYATSISTGNVLSVPKLGGTLTILASGLESPGSIAVDDHNVYFTTKTAVVKLDKLGGEPQVLASKQDPLWDLAIDDDFVYWGTSRDCGGIKRVPKSSTLRTTLAVDATPWSIAVDAGFVYWVSSESQAIMKMDKSGAGLAVVLAAGQSFSQNLFVDANGAYFTGAGVARLALTGGAPVTLAADQLQPQGLVADATHLYWTSSGIFRVSKAGGAVEQRVFSEGLSKAIAVDDTHVYFSDSGFANEAKRIRRAAK